MKRRFRLYCLLSVSGCLLTNITAASEIKKYNGIAIDVLAGEDDVTGLRLAYRPYLYTLTNALYFDSLDIY